MKTNLRLIVILFFLLPGSSLLAAGLKLPFVFSDDMVLQQGMADPVWGDATPGAKVTVRFAGQEKSAVAGDLGHWTLKLDALPASAQGRTMLVYTEDQTINFNNVVVGEVWICSGQSNMEKPIGEQRGQKPTVNWQQEIAAADHPLIHLLSVPKVKTADAIKTNWEICSPATVAREHFSAVGYFFGRKIQTEINVPVGLIHSSWGGTRIEPWTPAEGFDLVPSLKVYSSRYTGAPTTKISGPAPSTLYNVMIQPMVPFGIRGVIWYQGENNVTAHDGALYFDKMQALIGGWRQAWDQGDFPFYYVQLAPMTYTARKNEANSPYELPEVWDAQRRALSIPNTGMAVTTDLVSDFHDIHPTRKVEVGERLALWALARDYSKKSLECSGPLLKSINRKVGELTIHFDHADGLKTRNGKDPDEFEIAGPDGNYAPINASINGDAVVMKVDRLDPVIVRFGWTETATPNLINAAGLPASPFKTQPMGLFIP